MLTPKTGLTCLLPQAFLGGGDGLQRGKWGWMGRPYLCLIGGPALVAWREAGDVMCGKTGGPASPCCQCRRQGQLLEAARHPVSSLPSRSTSLSIAKSNSWDACAAPEALPHTTPRGLGAKPLTVAALLLRGCHLPSGTFSEEGGRAWHHQRWGHRLSSRNLDPVTLL